MTTNAEPKDSLLLSAALDFASNGFSVVPTRMDGSKAPIGAWKKYQVERANAMQIQHWYSHGETGLGIVTGRASGNLEMLEFEGRAIALGLLKEAAEIAEASGLGEIWSKITTGYAEYTPSGGLHFLYRISDEAVPGNTKLAQLPGEDGGCLIETRGEGGYCIVAPSHGSVHPSGKAWVAIAGSPRSVPVITWDERCAVHDVLKVLDKMPAPETVLEAIARPADAGSGVSPGDDYSARTSWDEILTPRGWSKVFTAGTTTYWRRPGKSIGISATTGRNEADNLFVFSTSTEFEAGKPYSKFAAFTHIEHHGDFKAAARHLRANGYGVPSIAPSSDFMVGDRPEWLGSGSTSGSTPNLTTPNLTTPGTATPQDGEPVKFLSHEEALIVEEIQKGRARRRAKEVLDSEDALRKYDAISYVETLGEELELPEEEIAWTIEGLLPRGANVTLTAQYKAGKTTMINNLAKALVDGERFLNFFKAPSHEGRVVIFNYEVGEGQYRRWLKDVSIKEVDRVTTVHLRGKSVPLKSEHVRDEVVEILRRLGCETWIVDPFARAFTGSGDENSNSDVGVFLDQLDIIKERAGVSNLILPVHTGRNQEMGVDRARGATRIDDWADVRWLLKKTDDGRFFSADGRDVLLEEQYLRYDAITRGLTLGGGDARTTKKANLEDLWVQAVLGAPGATTSRLCEILGKSTDDKALASARKSAEHRHLVKTRPGAGRSLVWYPIDYVVPLAEMLA